MNGRGRVSEALDHKIPDRVPVDFGSTVVTGMSVSIVSKLRDYYGLNNDPPVKVTDPYQMLGEIADDLKKVLGIDCVELPGRKNIFGFKNTGWKPFRLRDGTEVLVPGKFNTQVEKDGTIYQYPEGDKTASPSARMPKNGYFFDSVICQSPINNEKLNVEDNLKEFSIINSKDLAFIKDKAEYLYSSTDYAIVANFGISSFGDIAFVPGPMLKEPKGIRGIGDWYMSIATKKDHVKKIFSGQLEIAIENYKRIYEAIGNTIDVVFTSGTDFGMQQGLFISLDSYRDLFKPFNKKVNRWIHENTKWKTFIHTCGSVYKLIPDLIEAEFDILNPVQISASDMEPERLKKEFGKDIVFWGGGVDTQRTLPVKTPGQVKEEVKRLINIFGRGGGYVFNAVHDVQANVPIENLVAMFEILKKY